MSRSKKNITLALEALQEAFDRIEGEYSGIPKCCIDKFCEGRTYISFKESLFEREQKDLQKFVHVPCDECFNNKRSKKIKMNGTSDIGNMIFYIMKILKDKQDGAN